MLSLKMIKKDYRRKKSVTLVMFAFITLSAMLMALGSNLIVELSNSLGALFEKAGAPDFIQMHAGEIDQDQIDRWVEGEPGVHKQQTVEMINLDGSSLYLGGSSAGEDESIMDISFVTQNLHFDFLLDMDNQPVELSPGEIAVPVFFMDKNRLHAGDEVRISDGSFAMTFTVAGAARDALMNPAMVHSKRFLVHQSDFRTLGDYFHDREYLIEFMLSPETSVEEFSKGYTDSGLPALGPSVDITLFKMLNAMTDGLAAGVVIALSGVLMIIALLCLRFIILAAIEEEYREIGVMKAVGISAKDIKKIFLLKYGAVGILSALPGYLLSLFLNPYLLSNVLLYMGRAPKNLVQQLIPLLAAGSTAMAVLISCAIILRRFNRISAIEAFGSGSTGERAKNVNLLRLSRNSHTPVNLALGARDLVHRFRMFGLLLTIFFFCASFILIPLHFFTTFSSPSFVSYMGIGKSDIRIDLRSSDDTADRFAGLIEHISKDPDVKQYAPQVASRFTILNEDGSRESISIETGDFALFPLGYLEGSAPVEEDEIALSYKNSREMEKGIGDSIMLISGDLKKELRISGIYQDVTNGGRTAKAAISPEEGTMLWYSLSLDLEPHAEISSKIEEYSILFHPARVTDIEGYLHQTLGNTISQIRKVTISALVIGIFVSVLITALFMRMLIAKDSTDTGIMRSLGFSLRDIRTQYLARALVVLFLGISAGTLFSNTLGQDMVSFIWGFMGASRISFVIKPLQAYLGIPLLLMATVGITTIATVSNIKETRSIV
jgi:putative ABC transport system permease protein